MGVSNRGIAVQARHERFKQALRMNGGNATQAAITAGYSSKTAHVIGSQLLKRLKFEEAANERSHESLRKSLLTQETVLRQLERIVLADPRKLFNPDGSLKSVHQLDDDTAHALASFDQDEITTGRGRTGKVVGTSYKYRLHDKLQGIEKAMRMLGMFERDNQQKAERVEIAVNLVGGPQYAGDSARTVGEDRSNTGRSTGSGGPKYERPQPLTIDQYEEEKKRALAKRGT